MTLMNTSHHVRQKWVFVGEVEKLRIAISGGSANCSELGEIVLARKRVKMGR